MLKNIIKLIEDWLDDHEIDIVEVMKNFVYILFIIFGCAAAIFDLMYLIMGKEKLNAYLNERFDYSDETNTEATTEISTESIDIDEEVKKVTETITTEAEVVAIEVEAKQTEEVMEIAYTATPESFESEEELINFLTNREEKIKTIANDTNSTELPVEMEDALKEDVKFIWHEQELGGYTYDSLSNVSKVEVLDIFVETKQIVDEKYTNFSSEYTMLYVDDADLQAKYRSILDSIQAVEQKTLTK